MSIRDMEMLGIGKPNDVGGTETEGTVMAKENAILRILDAFSRRTLGNMVWKQISKYVTMPSSGYADITYEFEQPVRIIGISVNPPNTSGSGSATVYIINGEDSFSSSLYTDSRGRLGVFSRNAGSNCFIFNGVYQSSVEIMPVEIWATKVTLHIPVNDTFIAGKTTYSAIYYQEEAR